MRNKDITLCLTYYSHCMTLHPRAKRQSQYSYIPHMGGTMNRLFLLACCIFVLIGMNLLATNHLDIMHILQGEYVNSGMGSSLASLDFNGDGIEDLIVQQLNNPRPEHQGIYEYDRLMILFGGNNFDTTPELTIFGDPHDGHTPRRVVCVGDVNNDGYDDFVAEKMTWAVTPGYRRVCIYFGGVNPATTPGFQIDYPNWDSGASPGVESIIPRALGDINGDGCNDIGVISTWREPDHKQVQVLWGGSFALQTVYESYTQTYTTPAINGIGDINNDGIDDFVIGHGNFNSTDNNTVTLYYGNPDFSQCDSLSLVEYGTDEYAIKPIPGGDVNGDGYDDFLGRVSFVNDNIFGLFWLGGENISTQWNTELLPVTFGPYGTNYDVVHGDLNGDGFDDIVGSDYHASYDHGTASLWLGKQNFNGVADLIINPPSSIPPSTKFGYTIACGDFNNDGVDDLAVGAPVSAPGLSGVPGAVVIYSGNTLLADTTVANEDELAPQLPDQWQFTSYPNPLPAGKSLLLRYLGKGYEQAMTKNITLYNLKGQRVFQTQDSSQGETSSISLPQLPSGVYILSISEGNTRLGSKRIVVY